MPGAALLVGDLPAPLLYSLLNKGLVYLEVQGLRGSCEAAARAARRMCPGACLSFKPAFPGPMG